MIEINRKPPATVLHKLRSEVGFGCPVCGSPFLTWHHFDPPWKVQHHHNPEGMIALCPTHASHADGNHWTISQLRNMKHSYDPNKIIEYSWPWQPENIVCKLGDVFYVGPRNILSINGEEIFSAIKVPSKIENYNTIWFNAHLRNNEGKSILKIENNLLEFISNDFNKIYCPPQAREFTANSKYDVYFSLKYQRLSLDKFIRQIPMTTFNEFDTVESISKMITELALDSDGFVPIIGIRGFFIGEGIKVRITNNEFTCQILAYNNELVRNKGRFYHPIKSQGHVSIVIGNRELIRFG